MAKYGSNSVGFFIVDGVDLLATDVQAMEGPERESVMERTDGLGKTWEETSATGVKRAAWSWDRYLDDTINPFVGTEGTQRIACVSLTGNAVGAKFIGAAGLFVAKQSRSVKRVALHKVKEMATVTGAIEDGIVLQHVTAKTVDWNTEGAESQDNTVSSAAGGSGYLQVTALSGFTGFIGKIRHSADDSTYADLVTFTNVTSAPAAQRVTVAGTVNRHLAFNGDVTGSGSIQVMAGFCRG